MKRVRPIAACLLIAAAVACATAPPPSDTRSETRRDAEHVAHHVVIPDEPIEAVSEVSVYVARALDEERVGRLVVAGGSEVIHDAVEATLTANRKLNPRSPLRMDITLDMVKLRSTSNVVWVGSMSGPDKLEGVVTIWDGERLVQRYPVRVQSIRGGMWNGGLGSRYSLLAEEFAAGVVGGL